MKPVTIEGKEYEVPDDAEYVAMDGNGRWHWYSSKADKGVSVWYSHDVENGVGVHRVGGDYNFITKSTAWRNTLRKI